MLRYPLFWCCKVMVTIMIVRKRMSHKQQDLLHGMILQQILYVFTEMS